MREKVCDCADDLHDDPRAPGSGASQTDRIELCIGNLGFRGRAGPRLQKVRDDFERAWPVDGGPP